MKKIIALLILLTGVFFGLKKWSPRTLERIAFWNSVPTAQPVAPVAPPEPLPPLVPERVPERGPVTTITPDGVPTPAPAPVAVDKSAQVVVLCYHRIEGPTAGSYSITPELFEQHMQRLKDAGIVVISMQDFLAWRRGEKTISPKSALITVDDGYVSAFEVARPVLKKFGYPWTYFVYTNYIGRGGKSVTWKQLEELRDDGVEIGSHTISHQDLRDPRGKAPEAYETWLRDEILGSKQQLEQRLGIKAAVFAYPLGAWNSRIVDLVREAGYEAAFSVSGQRITHAAPAERLGRYAWDSRRPQDIELALKFQGPVASSPAVIAAAPSQPSPALLTAPLDGETIPDTQPALKVNLAPFGDLDPASVSMRLSGTGLIPHKFDPATKNAEARPPAPLKPGAYTVSVAVKVGGKRAEAQWTFHVDPTGAHARTIEQTAPQ